MPDQLVVFANPYIICVACAGRAIGIDADGRSLPCGHSADVKSVCPTWSPADGCLCQDFLGGPEHGTPDVTA